MALIPHPEHFDGSRDIELIDERRASRILADFDNGWYRAVERVFRLGDHGDYKRANALHATYRPSFVLAARIALRLTRSRSRV